MLRKGGTGLEAEIIGPEMGHVKQFHIAHTDEIPNELDFLYNEFTEMFEYWLQKKGYRYV